jgi:hypothetical protein
MNLALPRPDPGLGNSGTQNFAVHKIDARPGRQIEYEYDFYNFGFWVNSSARFALAIRGFARRPWVHAPLPGACRTRGFFDQAAHMKLALPVFLGEDCTARRDTRNVKRET